LSSGYSPPRRGGEGCGINKSREATEEAADGVVSSAKCLGLNSFAELTTPAAPISERIHFIDGASTPPLRGGEYSAAFLSIANSFTPSMTADSAATCDIALLFVQSSCVQPRLEGKDQPPREGDFPGFGGLVPFPPR